MSDLANQLRHGAIIPELLEEAAARIEALEAALQVRVTMSAARLEELEGVIDRADAHTAMLMQAIANLEAKLKAAEYAARVNYDGWQQEIARAALTPEQDK